MSQATNDDAQLKRLREILLSDDRQEFDAIRSILDNKDNLKVKVDPIIEDQIEFIQENFPDVFGKQVDKAIEQKITNSPELLLSILSPVLGRLIRKAIAQQLQQLRENIDEQIRKTFSRRGIIGRLKALLFGIKDGDIILSQSTEFEAELKEIYIIQRYSGLLMGSYSTGHAMDRDMIGGMLTAIKSFAEDAIEDEEHQGNEELEMIQYGVYKIYIQNFYNYYIAVVMMGEITTSDREEMADKLIKFAEREIKLAPKHLDSEYINNLSAQLEEYFKKEKND
ncbi:MAG: hypothetical protein AAF502_00535 [Bacteroidota bacterium]